MFRYRQSSLWFCRYGNRRCRYWMRPRAIVFRAAVSSDTLGNRCGQTGWNLSATLTPDHSEPVTGGINRSEPTGGEAYGTPRNTSTASSRRLSGVTITPLTSPYLVRTTRLDVSAALTPPNTNATSSHHGGTMITVTTTATADDVDDDDDDVVDDRGRRPLRPPHGHCRRRHRLRHRRRRVRQHHSCKPNKINKLMAIS